jgi:hypothetical protein
MIELLAIPGWQTGPTLLSDWVARLEVEVGGPVVVKQDPPQGAWIEVGQLCLRGFAMLAGPHVEAINFEVSAVDPAAAIQLLEATSVAIGWEIHPDDDDEEDEDDEDDE